LKSGWQHGLDTLAAEVGWPGWSGLITFEAVAGTLFWYLLSLVLYKVLPATEVQGTELKTGGRLTYRFNAFLSAVTILIVCAAGTLVQGPEFPVWTFINRNYLGLLTSNIVISYALATYVYVKSFSVKRGNKDKRELAAGGHSGNVIYDWYIGRELNPTVKLPYFGTIDIKSFMELRPGMIGWLVMDLAFVAKQFKSYGYVTDSIRELLNLLPLTNHTH
jgi:delta14-sterol reductase